MNHLSLTNLTRSELPRLPFRKITEKILSKKYSLSVVFTGNKRAARLNKKYRGKNYAPDAASRQAALFGEPTAKYIGRLFIHGLLHLKGYRHGSKMEHEERKILRRIDS